MSCLLPTKNRLKKALKKVERFHTDHVAKIEEYKTERKHINRLNSMHDIKSELNKIMNTLDWAIESKNWSNADLYDLSQFDGWVD